MALSGPQYLYKCPILEEMGAYDEDYPCGKYDPRHWNTLADMEKHLKRDNGWTDEDVDAWKQNATPAAKDTKRSRFLTT